MPNGSVAEKGRGGHGAGGQSRSTGANDPMTLPPVSRWRRSSRRRPRVQGTEAIRDLAAWWSQGRTQRLPSAIRPETRRAFVRAARSDCRAPATASRPRDAGDSMRPRLPDPPFQRCRAIASPWHGAEPSEQSGSANAHPSPRRRFQSTHGSGGPIRRRQCLRIGLAPWPIHGVEAPRHQPDSPRMRGAAMSAGRWAGPSPVPPRQAAARDRDRLRCCPQSLRGSCRTRR